MVLGDFVTSLPFVHKPKKPMREAAYLPPSLLVLGRHAPARQTCRVTRQGAVARPPVELRATAIATDPILASQRNAASRFTLLLPFRLVTFERLPSQESVYLLRRTRRIMLHAATALMLGDQRETAVDREGVLAPNRMATS